MSTPEAVIIISIASMVIAQVLKFFIDAIINKRVNESILLSTGGMPSSHSALVTSLATSIGLFEIHDNGQLSTIFAIALVLALVVLHDSMGIRYEASKHARELNQIKLRLNLIENIDVEEKKLKEALGHKPKEVFAGILLGAFIAIVGYFIFVNK
ncbi:divergent PAP2 family protein [Acholeplasma equirhinis]|uniref:divergent PAP2 family protein n=1 Tax=Acholeplasma equirhinis TaxID=555393 RepID=UPI00197AB32C|nr:divergent PAP2 family protein [Acholeplasma equirhinis]MBN3490995.1 divergent PAP2 family protein [Acholeplasma equirhinis]